MTVFDVSGKERQKSKVIATLLSWAQNAWWSYSQTRSVERKGEKVSG